MDITHAELRDKIKHHEEWLALKVLYPRTNLSALNLTNGNFHRSMIPSIIMRHADCTGADFIGSDMSCAKLTGTKFVGACFDHARLKYADLRFCDMTGADFTGADMSESDMSGANITGAKFCDANLEYANLSGVDISSANMTGANLTQPGIKKVVVDYEQCYQWKYTDDNDHLYVGYENDALAAVDKLNDARDGFVVARAKLRSDMDRAYAGEYSPGVPRATGDILLDTLIDIKNNIMRDNNMRVYAGDIAAEISEFMDWYKRPVRSIICSLCGREKKPYTFSASYYYEEKTVLACQCDGDNLNKMSRERR